MKTAVTLNEAKLALEKYREAVLLIRRLLRSALPRWSGGMRTWFPGEHPPSELAFSADEPEEPELTYNEEELATYRIARELLIESIELNPFYPDTYVLLGNAYGEIDGDMDKTIEYLSAALQIDPNDDEIVNGRMAMHLNAGDLEAARLDLEQLEALESYYARSMREHYEQAVAEKRSLDKQAD
ncbi:hypothetical protein [Aeoliella sp.]|uniref:hypothetical protein n=1 Tax=Aeoliella sp. TaxID=2795800 RepID=UPI003CCB74AE